MLENEYYVDTVLRNSPITGLREENPQKDTFRSRKYKWSLNPKLNITEPFPVITQNPWDSSSSNTLYYYRFLLNLNVSMCLPHRNTYWRERCDLIRFHSKQQLGCHLSIQCISGTGLMTFQVSGDHRRGPTEPRALPIHRNQKSKEESTKMKKPQFG